MNTRTHTHNSFLPVTLVDSAREKEGEREVERGEIAGQEKGEQREYLMQKQQSSSPLLI